jgi:hypothetical protein
MREGIEKLLKYVIYLMKRGTNFSLSRQRSREGGMSAGAFPARSSLAVSEQFRASPQNFHYTRTNPAKNF